MIKYIINKEKRTVVAVIEFGKNEETFKNSSNIYNGLSWAVDHLRKSKYEISKEDRTNMNKMYFPKYMSAKSKCNPEDEWDEEYGKQLARQRLVEKIYKYRRNSYLIISNMAQKIINIILYKGD